MTMAEVPQYPFEFQFGANGAAEVEQDSFEDVAACVQAIFMTELGYREGWPELGVDPGLFMQLGNDMSKLLSEVVKWEPRGPDTITADIDKYEAFTLRIRALVQDRTNNG